MYAPITPTPIAIAMVPSTPPIEEDGSAGAGASKLRHGDVSHGGLGALVAMVPPVLALAAVLATTVLVTTATAVATVATALAVATATAVVTTALLLPVLPMLGPRV